MDAWENVKNRAPDVAGRYLVVVGRAEITIASCRRYMNGFAFFRDCEAEPLGVPHWMNLPPLPIDR